MSENDTFRKGREMRKVAVKAFVCFFGYFIAVGPYVAVSGLQSSVNIKESVGTISLGVANITSFLTSLFVTPAFIRRFGCKYALLVGEFAHLLYIVANFYPVSYVMITVGVISGVGESMIWTAMPMFSQYFGIKQSVHGTKRRTFYIENCNAIFLGSYFVGQMFGFTASYAFLFGGKTGIARTQLENETFQYSTASSLRFRDADLHRDAANMSNISISETSPHKFCGARDCQDPNITKSHIDHYVPADKKFLFILLAVFCLLSVVGIALHARFLPVAKPKEFHHGSLKNNDKSSGTAEAVEEKRERSQTVASTLVATFQQAVNAKQILLVPLLLHGGLFYGFYLGELSRAFASCILGVEKVGLALVVFSSCGVVSSFSYGKIISFFGRNKVIPVILAVDLCNYAFCLLWKPQESTSSLVFAVFAISGITEPGWKNCGLSAYADYFSKNQEIALTMWNIYVTVGIAISFCWSPLLCVSTKIYIQATLLTVGAIAYGAAEFRYQRQKQAHNRRSDTDESVGNDENQALTTERHRASATTTI